MQHPDVVTTPVSRLAEIESRMGIPTLDSLLAERDELVSSAAPLRARHGPGGTYPDLRKIELAKIAQIIRASAIRDGVKMTEAAIEEAAHADPRYIEYVTEATKQKAQLAIAENRIQGVNETVYRGNAVARFLASEAQL